MCSFFFFEESKFLGDFRNLPLKILHQPAFQYWFFGQQSTVLSGVLKKLNNQQVKNFIIKIKIGTF
jgi:hypothetical protein